MILNWHPDYNDPAWAGKRFIGYWRGSEYNDRVQRNLPDPKDYIDSSWNVEERTQVANRLHIATIFIQWKGYSSCRLCTGHYGTNCRTFDGTWVFPAGFVHYIEVHNLRPPQSFIDHVLGLPAPLVTELSLHETNTAAALSQFEAMKDGHACEVRATGGCEKPNNLFFCKKGNTTSGSCVAASDFIRQAVSDERDRHRVALADLGVQVRGS